jgi:hypothetical protein
LIGKSDITANERRWQAELPRRTETQIPPGIIFAREFKP